MAYLPKLNPTVGGGLGGLPERRATGGAASANSVQRSIIGQAVKGSLAYRNTTTGDTYSLDPIEGLTPESYVSLTNKINSTSAAVSTAMFTDGKFVNAYSNASGVCFEVYNFDGTINVSQVVVDNLYVAGKRIVVVINPLNEYINIFFASGLTGNTIRRAVYTKSGTVVSAAATFISTRNTSDWDDTLAVDFFNDGYFVVGSVNSASTTATYAIYNPSGTMLQNVSLSFDYQGGRMAVKCLSTAEKTFAVTVSQAGGIVQTAGRLYVYVYQLDDVTNNLYNIRDYLCGDLGGTGQNQKAQICYNEFNGEVTGFYCSENEYVSMCPSELFLKSTANYSPPKQRSLPYSKPNNFTATSLGGDRFLVTLGGNGSGNPIYAGIMNSYGDWITSPTVVKFKGSAEGTYGYVRSAASNGRAVIVVPSGTGLFVYTYTYRNTATETYRLKDQYPIKIVDFEPWISTSNPTTMHINASQATNKFVLAYTRNYRDVTWAIYTSGGTPIGGPFINRTLTSSQYAVDSLSTLLLPNGNIAVIVSLSNNSIKFGIYDSSGALQGSIVTVVSNGRYHVAEVASNGNFLIAYQSTANSFLNYACYDQTGASVGASSISTQTVVYDYTRIIYSAVNNLFLVTGQQGSNSYIYYSSRTVTGAQNVGWQVSATLVANRYAVVCNPDGTWSFFYEAQNSNLLYFRKLTSGFTNLVPLTSLDTCISHGSINAIQLLPFTNSELLLLSGCDQGDSISAIKLSNTNGSYSQTTKSFGIGAAWYEKYFIAIGSTYIKYRNDINNLAMTTTTSLNGDQYIATAWGDVFRLSPSLPLGDYVIDGVINTEAINGTAEVITTGGVQKQCAIPRLKEFTTNANGSKKIVAAGKAVYVSS